MFDTAFYQQKKSSAFIKNALQIEMGITVLTIIDKKWPQRVKKDQQSTSINGKRKWHEKKGM